MISQRDCCLSFDRDFNKERSRAVLRFITSGRTKNVYVALKPDYLDIYGDISETIPGIDSCDIVYNKENIVSIITEYGLNISQFKNAYNQYVKPSLDEIALILWNKDSIPLTIFDYYFELNSNLDKLTMGIESAVSIANSLPKKRKKYYEKQFKFLANLSDKHSDTEFLYTLKLAYDLGLERFS